MPSFDVRFIKTVCDDTGHEHRACQAAFSVEAPSLAEAVQRAEVDFCRQKRARDWTIFADSVEFRSARVQTCFDHIAAGGLAEGTDWRR